MFFIKPHWIAQNFIFCLHLQELNLTNVSNDDKVELKSLAADFNGQRKFGLIWPMPKSDFSPEWVQNALDDGDCAKCLLINPTTMEGANAAVQCNNWEQE